MKNVVLRGILAVIVGWFIGSVVNMSIITVGPSVFGIPDGVNVQDIESIKSHLHLFEPIHFMGPILAHGLGTLVGAFVAAKIALTKKMMLGMIIAVLFLAGGVMMVMFLPEQPLWVKALDLLLAYVPMGYLGVKLAK